MISPHALLGDSDTSTKGAVVWVGDNSVVSDSDFPSDSSVDLARGYGAARVNASNEVVVYLPQPPPNWKIVSLYISVMHKSTYASTQKQVEVFSRNYVHSVRPGITAQQSDHLTFHKTKADNVYTNALINLSPPYIHDGTNYCMVFISSGSSNSLLLGGFVEIMRV